MEFPLSKQQHNFIINMLVNTYGYKSCPEFVKYFDSEVFEHALVRKLVWEYSYGRPFRFAFYVKKHPDPNDTNFYIELYSDYENTYENTTVFEIDLGCFPKKPRTAKIRRGKHVDLLFFRINEIVKLYEVL